MDISSPKISNDYFSNLSDNNNPLLYFQGVFNTVFINGSLIRASHQYQSGLFIVKELNKLKIVRSKLFYNHFYNINSKLILFEISQIKTVVLEIIDSFLSYNKVALGGFLSFNLLKNSSNFILSIENNTIKSNIASLKGGLFYFNIYDADFSMEKLIKILHFNFKNNFDFK
jgi:hypothetical protein